MSSPAFFRNFILTSSSAARHYRPAPTSFARTSTTARLYQPILTHRFFHFTSKMAEAGSVHNLTNKEAFDKAIEGEELVVLDCFATWCGPCKMIAPQVAKMATNYTDARFFKLDVDEVPDVAQELGIRAMPTFLLFKGGEKVGEVVGANPKALEAAVQKNLEGNAE